MAKRWSPVKATIVTVVVVLVVVLLGGGVLAAADVFADSEKSGEKVGRALVPLLVLAGIVAYFVQKSRIADDNKPDRR